MSHDLNCKCKECNFGKEFFSTTHPVDPKTATNYIKKSPAPSPSLNRHGRRALAAQQSKAN